MAENKNGADESRIWQEPEKPQRYRQVFSAWPAWLAFLTWGGIVFGAYFSKFNPDPGFFYTLLAAGHLLNIVSGLFFVFACFGIGRFLLGLFRFTDFNFFEDISFSTALGFTALGSLILGLAALGLLYKWPALSLLVSGAALGSGSVYLRPLPSLKEAAGDFTAGDVPVFLLLFLAALLNLAGALGPEIFYDSLVYHLAVPGFYNIKHGLADVPYNIHSNLPLLHSMLYSAGLLLKDEVVPKLINYAAGLLTLAVALGAGARLFNVRAGLWAGVIFYTMTHAMVSAWGAGSDALVTFFSFAALAAVLNHKKGKKWLWLAAVLAGSAMAVKYMAVFSAAGIMLVYLYGERKTPAPAFKNLVLFVLLASLPVLPWLAKNYAYRGNPVYPFLTSVFHPREPADPLKIKSFLEEARQMGGLTLKSWISHPWRVTMGQADNSKYFTPLLLFFLPLAFLLPSAWKLAGLWIYFLTVWLMWSVSSTMARFSMPAWPAAGLIISAKLFSTGQAELKKILRAVVLAVCFAGVYWAALVFYAQERWQPALGFLTNEEFLAKTRATYSPYSHYSAIEFINDKLPAGVKTLVVGDSRGFYFKKDFVISSAFDKTPLVEYAAASKTGEELYIRLKADGVTHLLINAGEAVRLGRDYGMFYWDARARGVFNSFWNAHLKEVFAWEEQRDGRFFNRVAVYEIAPALPTGTPPSPNMMEELVMKNLDTMRPAPAQ